MKSHHTLLALGFAAMLDSNPRSVHAAVSAKMPPKQPLTPKQRRARAAAKRARKARKINRRNK